MNTSKPQAAASSPALTLQENGENTIQRISARHAEVGGIPINRLMPSRQRRTIGAWCFLDHAGPAQFAPGAGMRVGPHPHIGLQTFTWMIKGEVLHRDSLGNEQIIRPGQVNLMTAGRGIAHTEESLSTEDTLHAAQLWIALPPEASACAPAFEHHPNLPSWSTDGCDFTLLAGSYNTHHAPARLYSPLVGMDLFSTMGADIHLPLNPEFEYGLLMLEGQAEINKQRFAIDELAYLGHSNTQLHLQLSPGSRAILLGGEPCTEEILIWWNFVGHSKAEIAQAQHDWEAGNERFGAISGYDGPRLTAPPLPWSGL
ncbi:pirin family protein [Alcaligenaceae bacterium]|nr:pirin family protein [Alcaligenaceae bacterium]